MGDLIILPKMWAEVDVAGWAFGACDRTKTKVRVHMHCVVV